MYKFATYKDQYKANLRLALPVVLTQLGQILTQVADNLMVGRYGGSDPTPLAAVSFGGAVFFILFIAAVGIALGMTPLVGELYAQGDREKSAGLLQNGTLFYGLLGLTMAVVQYAAIPLLYHLGQPAEVVDMAIPCYKMLVYSMPFIMLFFTFKQFLEGVGNTKVEMFVTIAANLANIGFNWVFIYGRYGFPEMGAEGAGLATFLSNCVACLYFFVLLYVKRGRTYVCVNPKMFSFKRHIVVGVCAVGIPASIQNLLNVTGMSVLNNFTSAFGSNAVAAMGIAQKINSVTVQIALGLSQGIMPLISYNYASGNIKRMKKTFFFTARIALVFLVLMEIAYYAGARTWVGLFMQDQQIVDYGARFLQGFCLGMPFLAIDFLAVGVFQACGLGKNAFLFAILRKVVLEIPALFILNALFPLYGLAYAQFAAELVLAIAAVIVLARLFRKLERRYQPKG